jgi:hypothetical protein
MINEVLEHINKYFVNYNYQSLIDSTFIATNTITGDFEDTFLVGEWIMISGTRLNDGVYLISTINTTSLTIDISYDKSIKAEDETESVLYRKLDIPASLVSIVVDIKTHQATESIGIKSESQGNTSVTYDKSSGWQGVFASKLSQWRKLRW